MGPMIDIQRIHPAAALPQYMSELAAGADLRAALDEPLDLAPGLPKAVPCGFKMALPPGYEAQIRPRSGLALKRAVTVANAPGTVDADYRGEVKVILINLGNEGFTIEPGDRIAQMVVAPVTRAAFGWSETLSDSTRGAGGFGSTGSG